MKIYKICQLSRPEFKLENIDTFNGNIISDQFYSELCIIQNTLNYINAISIFLQPQPELVAVIHADDSSQSNILLCDDDNLVNDGNSLVWS